MREFLAITCPQCLEDSEVEFDPGEGSSEFIVDCQVCCRPMTVKVRMRDGEIQDVQVNAA